MNRLDGIDMLNRRLLAKESGSGSVAYAELMAEMQQFLDSYARARLHQADIAELRPMLAKMRQISDAREAPEEDRPFGRGREGAGRVQCLVPEIIVHSMSNEVVEATVTMGDYFLGVNGAAHGGAVTLIFDEVLGRLSSGHERPPSRTAYLNTTFFEITPIGIELRIRAWMQRLEGRKRFVAGEIMNGDRVCARAEALFVELKVGQK